MDSFILEIILAATGAIAGIAGTTFIALAKAYGSRVERIEQKVGDVLKETNTVAEARAQCEVRCTNNFKEMMEEAYKTFLPRGDFTQYVAANEARLRRIETKVDRVSEDTASIRAYFEGKEKADGSASTIPGKTAGGDS